QRSRHQSHARPDPRRTVVEDRGARSRDHRPRDEGTPEGLCVAEGAGIFLLSAPAICWTTRSRSRRLSVSLSSPEGGEGRGEEEIGLRTQAEKLSESFSGAPHPAQSRGEGVIHGCGSAFGSPDW